MRILGTGLVCAQGRGKDAVIGEPKPASFIDVPFQDEPFPVFAVAPETLKDPVFKGMRRADRFSKMATLAACDSVADSGVDVHGSDRTGIIFATAFGPHNTTFKFQDDIIDYGDAGVSPTIFSNSVHNAAVSYISRTLGIKGPTWTITAFHNPFEQAAALAKAWLAEGRCDRILLGAADECGTVMEYICSQKLPIAADGKVKLDDPPAYVPGEGAAFFLVDGSGTDSILPSLRRPYTECLGNMLVGSVMDVAMKYLETNREE